MKCILKLYIGKGKKIKKRLTVLLCRETLPDHNSWINAGLMHETLKAEVISLLQSTALLCVIT